MDFANANLDPPVTVLYMIDRFICVHGVETLACLKFKSFYVQNERCYVINYFILPCKHLIYFTCISGYIAAYGMFILENLIVNCKLNQNKVYIRVTWPSVHSCDRKKDCDCDGGNKSCRTASHCISLFISSTVLIMIVKSFYIPVKIADKLRLCMSTCIFQ